jgi:polysaccharide export outer membrane protein
MPIEVPIRAGDMLVVPEAGTVTVEGEVQKGGSFDLGRKSTLLGALAAAGGITYGANVGEVEVVRDLGSDEKVHLILDLTQVISGETRDLKLRNGDVVRVPSDSGRRLRQDTFEAIGKVINVGVGGTVNVVN